VLFFSGQVGAADLLEKASKNGHTFELLRKPLHPTELIARLLEVANAKPELSSARPSKPLVDKCV
jgi:hypothetical protein